MHPAQFLIDAEPGLVEVRHRRGRDPGSDGFQETVQVSGGAGGDGGDSCVAYRDIEQIRERLRGTFLGKELSHVKVDHERG